MRVMVRRHYLAAGVRPDVEQFLTDFTALDSLRYEAFAVLWRERNTSLIFIGRDSEMELREFTEELLRITAEFLVPPFSFQVQVGAVYLLYGLFFKQPNNPRSRIRLTMATWDHIQNFLGEVYEQQHLDVAFIFLKLEHARAFDFVAHTTQVVPLRAGPACADDREQLEADSQHLLAIERPELADVINLSDMANIHLRYQQMKVTLAPEGSTKPQASLDVIENDFIGSITQEIDRHERWRSRKISGKHRGATEKVTENADPPEEGLKETVGTRRARLKERAYRAVPHRDWRLQQRSNADEVSTDISIVGSPRLQDPSLESLPGGGTEELSPGTATSVEADSRKRQSVMVDETSAESEEDSCSNSKSRRKGRRRDRRAKGAVRSRGKGRGASTGQESPVVGKKGRAAKKAKGNAKKS